MLHDVSMGENVAILIACDILDVFARDSRAYVDPRRFALEGAFPYKQSLRSGIDNCAIIGSAIELLVRESRRVSDECIREALQSASAWAGKALAYCDVHSDDEEFRRNMQIRVNAIQRIAFAANDYSPMMLCDVRSRIAQLRERLRYETGDDARELREEIEAMGLHPTFWQASRAARC